MTRQLRVFGWTGMTPLTASYRSNGRQSRFIVAAHSVSEVCRLAGISRSTYAWSGAATMNASELATALAQPLTVLHQHLDTRNNDWEALS